MIGITMKMCLDRISHIAKHSTRGDVARLTELDSHPDGARERGVQ
jgi:hypothetical protein